MYQIGVRCPKCKELAVLDMKVAKKNMFKHDTKIQGRCGHGHNVEVDITNVIFLPIVESP